jgi:hypothetical protein
VTITGADFTDASRVWFDDTAASAVTVQRYDQIIAIAPAHASGTVAVRVQTAAGTSPPVAYTYTSAAPVSSAGNGAASAPTTGCVVPDLRGRTVAGARRRLTASGCTLGHVRRTTSRHGSPTARVIAQSPKPGTHQPRGGRVRITTRTHR